MKKIYFLFLLTCLTLSAYSQTVVIYATGAAGSFKTGYAASTPTRTDGTIFCTGSAPVRRGYAVFDLSVIPAGSAVTSVTCDLNITGVGAGTTAVCSTNVYNGDLSLVTVPATLYADMAVPPSVSGSTVSYGPAIGNISIASTPATAAAVAASAGGKVSFVFTNTGTALYTFTGETGAAILSGTHAPYITVTYCPPPTGVTASASPASLCSGDNLTLTGAATTATAYSWAGPGGYTSALLNPPAFATGLTSAGVYTLTAMNTCGTYTATATATTAVVTINPLPAAITGASAVCVGGATTLTGDGTIPGNWTSSDVSKATIDFTTGTVIGVASGAVTMTYTVATGCFVTFPMTVNDPPGPISGPSSVCVAATITLSDIVPGGNWTSSSSGIATVGGLTGIVTGVATGAVTITFTPPGCSFSVYTLTVNPLPSAITGPANVCVGQTITETESDPGGTWSSSSISTALVGSTGIVTGVSGGPVNVIFTFSSTGCQAVKAVMVNALPAAIAGPTDVCETLNITLTDATGGGAFSGGAPNATVTFAGVVTGLSAGAATITYSIFATGCYITTPINVDPAPAPITGTTILCENTTTTLSDADAGGTWSSLNPANGTVGSTTGIVTAISNPGATIVYTLPTGCTSQVGVLINPAPVSVITPVGATTFCAGSNVVLNATTGAGLTYQWNNGGVPIPGETTSTYTASTSGSFTVDITNSLGCTTRSAAEIVTAGINAVIDHATSLNFCIGSSLVLTANTGSVTGLITYQWQKDGVDISGATFVNYSATTSGSYQAVVTVSGGSGSCLVTSAPVNVLVNPLPTPVISYTGYVLSTPNTYAAYQWFLNTVAIPGAIANTYHPTANGSYRVRASDGIGCAGYSSAFPVSGVGVTEINKTGVSIYPNPTKDMLHIESPNVVKAVITGLEGKVLLSVNNARELDVSSLASGLYIIMLYNESGERVMLEKLIKD